MLLLQSTKGDIKRRKQKEHEPEEKNILKREEGGEG